MSVAIYTFEMTTEGKYSSTFRQSRASAPVIPAIPFRDSRQRAFGDDGTAGRLNDNPPLCRRLSARHHNPQFVIAGPDPATRATATHLEREQEQETPRRL
jgi:hypothetical protein